MTNWQKISNKFFKGKKLAFLHLCFERNVVPLQLLKEILKILMKKSRIILIIVIFLPLMCIGIQGRKAFQINMVTEAILTEAPIPLTQLPLEEERQYAENIMQCAISVSTLSVQATKWYGTLMGNSSDTEHRCHWIKNLIQIPPHFLYSSDGRSVIIRIRHLII